MNLFYTKSDAICQECTAQDMYTIISPVIRDDMLLSSTMDFCQNCGCKKQAINDDKIDTFLSSLKNELDKLANSDTIFTSAIKLEVIDFSRNPASASIDFTQLVGKEIFSPELWISLDSKQNKALFTSDIDGVCPKSNFLLKQNFIHLKSESEDFRVSYSNIEALYADIVHDQNTNTTNMELRVSLLNNENTMSILENPTDLFFG